MPVAKTVSRAEFDAVVAQLVSRTTDAVAYRFWAGESVEDIAKVYALTRLEVERYIRAYMNR